MIIFDSSPLILVAKVELLDLFLASIRLEVAIPEEVERECCGVKKTLDELIIQKALDESRIRVMAVSNKKLIAKLQADFNLGAGEAAAIALALKQQERLLGVDDKNAINACKLLGIGFTTALGILLRSREKGLIDRGDVLSKLAALARYGRYKDTIVEDTRLKLGAQK